MRYLVGIIVVLFASLHTSYATAQTLTVAQIEDLKSTVWSSIQKKHEVFGETKFDGSYDWHSDVHAHWALLSMARLTGDQELESKMQSILTMARIETEYTFLTTDGSYIFERPYGRSWLLLLLQELSLRPDFQNNNRFQYIRSELNNDILKWLEKTAFPENTTTNELIGSHESWLMSLFLFKVANQNDPSLLAQVHSLIERRLRPMEQKIKGRTMDAFDFLFLPSLVYLIDPKEYYTGPMLPVPPPTEKLACHYPGAVQVSIWAHSFQCYNSGDTQSCLMARNTTQEFMANIKLWKEDFDCVSHWVPQFVWMNHWLSLGMQ